MSVHLRAAAANTLSLQQVHGSTSAWGRQRCMRIDEPASALLPYYRAAGVTCGSQLAVRKEGDRLAALHALLPCGGRITPSLASTLSCEGQPPPASPSPQTSNCKTKGRVLIPVQPLLFVASLNSTANKTWHNFTANPPAALRGS